MQTTLRIQDAIYREAKAEAAREGVTLTRFIENALRHVLHRNTGRSMRLPVYDSGVRLPEGFDVAVYVREAEKAYTERLAAKLTGEAESGEAP